MASAAPEGILRPETNGINGHAEKPATTTISTIAVQSGNTRIVIALLQSKEWIQLKIQEMQPGMTDIGQSYEEATDLYQQHEKVLEKLQTKQSPVEELLRQADELISTQKPRGEVYSAMAENLGLAWKDLNAQLEQRRQILEQAVAFFARAKDFSDSLDRIQKNFSESYLPDTVELCTIMLQRHQEERKVALSCSMHMLNEGQHLQQLLCEVATHSMGDSRPFHMQHAAKQTSAFVERYMESLHDRWRQLEALWTQRKLKLEQCLKKCQLLTELNEVQNWLRVKGEEFLKQQNLGDSLASSEILQHEHTKVEKEAQELQDRCLKLVRTTEQISYSGHYGADELKAKAYEVLSDVSEFLSFLETRRLLLAVSVAFFSLAQTALNKLDQIEVQLTTSEVPRSGITSQSYRNQIIATVEEITAPAIEEGYNLINRAGSHEPGAQGVARKVAELEEKKNYLLQLCSSLQVEDTQRSNAFKNFNNNYTLLLNWIKNNGQGFLQRYRDMGTTQATAKTFVDQHESHQNDLRMKGMELEALLSTVPPLVRMGGEEAQDVHQKSENLRDEWNKLQNILEKRIKIAHCYLSFHKLATRVTKEMDDLESAVKRNKESSTQYSVRTIEEKFLSLQQEILQLNNSGRNFLEDAQKVDDMYLNMALPCSTVQNILDRTKSRKEALSVEWADWQNQVSSTRETLIQWEHLVKDSHRVIKCATELEGKMFPVIPKELNRVDSILPFLENRMAVLLPQIKNVQQEMENFLKKSDVLCPKESPQPEGLNMIKELQKMNQSFQKKFTDYQILISMMTSYFKNFVELEKLVDMQETQFKMTSLPNDAVKVEALLHEHDACKPTVFELFKFTNNEGEQVIKKINEAEPPEAAVHDRDKILSAYESRKKNFELSWEEHKRRLEQHLQHSIFNRDMKQINQQIDELSSHLLAIRDNYGESFPSAVATSEAFVQFEKTIELLQIRIQHFISTAEKMMQDRKVDADQVHKQIQNMQNKWSTFHTEVSGQRKLIDVAIEYFKLVEESEEWLKEGSRVLISVARKSSICKSADDANTLRNEIQVFLDQGRNKQEERIRKISSLSVQLYGDRGHAVTQQVSNKNKDMLDSFSVISSELNILTENIKLAEAEKVKEQKEKEEIDAALHAAQAEAEAAKAAAAAAQEAAKAAEAAAKATLIQKEEVKVIETKLTTAVEEKRTVLVNRPPVFIVPLTDAEVSEGVKFTFECKVDGYPEPQVQWFKDGILAENNLDYQTKYSNGICTLTIEETFSEDTARFTCKASNVAGVAETHGNLVVKESRIPEGLIPPHFIREPVDATVIQGKPHQFDCQVSGNPLPLVSWFKDDVCIDNSADYHITYNNGVCVLRFEDISHDYKGRYTCRATNQAGQVACSAKLQVLSSTPSERPVFIVPLSNVMARAGQKLRLECTISGQPEPEITWLHNSKSIKETRDIKMTFDGQKATLVITEAFPKDAGIYTVVAKNIAGEAVSTSTVSVKGRLPLETSDSEMASDIEPAKPQVKQHLDNQTVKEGNKVRMDCIIVGQPEPEVIWYHNGKPVKESDDFQLLFEGDRCTLIIKVAYLEDAGTYRCVAINSGGEASSQCVLTIESASETEDKSRYSQKDIILTVNEPSPPKFLRLLKDVTCVEGKQAKLECQVAGEPEIITRWYKDGKELHTSAEYQLSSDTYGTSTLIIYNCKQSHGGTYSVTAENKGGEAKSFCCLRVTSPTVQTATQTSTQESPPVFVKHIQEVHVLLGQPVTFENTITGTPKPQVKWTFEGQELSPDNEHEIKEEGNKHWLTLPKVSRNHKGRYAAVAENNAGVATSSAMLHIEDGISQTSYDSCFQEQTAQSMIMSKKTTVMQTSTISSMTEIADDIPPVTEQANVSELKEYVQTQPSMVKMTCSEIVAVQQIGSAPKFTRPVVPASITEGEKLLLEGIITGSPTPNVQWFKENTELTNTLRISLSYALGKATLFIPNAKEDDSGKYSCVASNPSGKATSTAEVRVKPLREAPRFVKHLQAGIVKSGARVCLEVEITGIPKPDVKWYRNNSVVANSPDFRITSDGNKHSILIPEAFPDDSGIFMVVATNVAGEARSIVDLIVDEDKSPEEDKFITYEELSSVQKKKEMFTKISLAKTTQIEPYAITSTQESEVKQEYNQTTKPSIPSPPPMPAVTSKVWTQVKPLLFPAPAVIEAPAIEDAVIAYPDILETDFKEIEAKEVVKEKIPIVPVIASESVPVSTSAVSMAVSSESFVKQSIKKFSEPKESVESKKVSMQEKDLKPQVLMQPLQAEKVIQNGIEQSVEQMTSTMLTSSYKSNYLSKVSSSDATHSMIVKKEETTPTDMRFSSFKSVASSDIKVDEPIKSVWKSTQDLPDTKKSWRPVQPPTTSSTEPVLTSANITEYRDTAITPVTKVDVSSAVPDAHRSTETVTKSYTKFSSEETTVTKKYETVTEHKQVVSSQEKPEPVPKPIIKKETHADVLKPKKEVVIQEEPVVAAEVKPPHFSKVRGANSFRKIL